MSKVAGRTISGAALVALRQSTWPAPDMLVLPEKLARPLYLECADILKTLGGEWNRKRKGTVFQESAVDALEVVLDQGRYVSVDDVRKHFQEYETPSVFAQSLVDRFVVPWLPNANPQAVLEPSAGSGRLLGALLSAVPQLADRVDAYEIQPKHEAALLAYAGVRVTIGDFLTSTTRSGGYDLILMNPPFSRQQDAQHIMAALDQLRVGGRLIAIASPAIRWRQTKHYEGLRERLDASYGWTMYDNPEATFASEGTNINTVTLVVDRPKA